MELLRPSFEECSSVNKVDEALDLIARRTGEAHTCTREKRINMAREIL
jgi:hypothetical protein